MITTAPRAYRSKIEVLRDFLRAARDPAPKTRIIGAANLNPASFQRYLKICTEHDLIVSVSGGYVITGRASPVLEAIDALIGKRDDLDRAYRHLHHQALARHSPPTAVSPFRHVLRDAWTEIVLQPAASRSGGFAVTSSGPLAPHRSHVEGVSTVRRTGPGGAASVAPSPARTSETSEEVVSRARKGRNRPARRKRR